MVKFKTKDGKTVSFRSKGEKKMARRKGGRRKSSGRSRSGGYINRARSWARGRKVPLTLTYIGTGAVVDVFNIAPDTRKTLFTGLQTILSQAGLNYKVDGYTIGGVLLVVKFACSLSPWFHAKVNGFLAGFGMTI